MQINQFVPTISPGDAVSNNILGLREILVENGYKSDIYVKHIHVELKNKVKPVSKYRGDASNLLFYHFAFAGMDFTDSVIKFPDTKILVYHNITPAEFFYNYDNRSYFGCKKGREELAKISKFFDLGIGVSNYNRQELEEIGFKKTAVLPIFIDTSAERVTDPKLDFELSNNGKTKLLFVGRIAPNKRQEDIVKVFYLYNKYINSNSQLFIVGSGHTLKYAEQLKNLVSDLGLSRDVIFSGHVSQEALHSYYDNADVFLCMSEHEGFCVPLLEAMRHGVPIIAYESSAVAETLGDSGITVDEKDYVSLAELVNIVVDDQSVRRKIINAQKERLMSFDKKIVSKKLLDIIADVNNL